VCFLIGLTQLRNAGASSRRSCDSQGALEVKYGSSFLGDFKGIE